MRWNHYLEGGRMKRAESKSQWLSVQGICNIKKTGTKKAGSSHSSSLTCLPTWQTIIITKGRNGKEEAIVSRWPEMGCSCGFLTLLDRYNTDDKNKISFLSKSGITCITFLDTFLLKMLPITQRAAEQGILSPFVKWRNGGPWGFYDFPRVVIHLVSGWAKMELQNLQCQIRLISVPRHLCTITYSSWLWLQIKATYVQSNEKENQMTSQYLCSAKCQSPHY